MRITYIQDVSALHQRFFEECFKRMDELQLHTEGEDPVASPSKLAGQKTMDM